MQGPNLPGSSAVLFGAACGLLLTALLGCHGGPDAGRYRRPEPEVADPNATLPAPFTAEQIRAATPDGRRDRYRVITEGVVGIEMFLEFHDVGEEGGLLRTTTLTAGGDPLDGPQDTPFTWEDLRRHALFPAGTTRITEAQVSVPGGVFDCLLYSTTTRVDGSVMVERSWFAKSLPGAPVKQVTELDGKVISATELLRHHRP